MRGDGDHTGALALTCFAMVLGGAPMLRELVRRGCGPLLPRGARGPGFEELFFAVDQRVDVIGG
jgi:hypothetical protein